MEPRKFPAGNPDSPHWWLKPMELEELKKLILTVREVHINGLGFCSAHMNRIEIALETLKAKMEASR